MRNTKKLIVIAVMVAVLSACASTDVRKTSNLQNSTSQVFTLRNSSGKAVTLSDVLKEYRGAVIAFYPKDDSRN